MGRNSLKEEGFGFFGIKTMMTLLTIRERDEVMHNSKQVRSYNVPAMTKKNHGEAVRTWGTVRVKAEHS